MIARVTLAFVLLATSAAANPLVPSERYDYPYPWKRVVESLDYWKVRERCATAWDIPRGGWADACSWAFVNGDGPGCHMIFPRLARNAAVVDGANDGEVENLVALIRQENATCNGFRPDGTDL